MYIPTVFNQTLERETIGRRLYVEREYKHQQRERERERVIFGLVFTLQQSDSFFFFHNSGVPLCTSINLGTQSHRPLAGRSIIARSKLHINWSQWS